MSGSEKLQLSSSTFVSQSVMWYVVGEGSPTNSSRPKPQNEAKGPKFHSQVMAGSSDALGFGWSSFTMCEC